MVNVASTETEGVDTIQEEQINETRNSDINESFLHIRAHNISLNYNQRVALAQDSIFIHGTTGKIINGTQTLPQKWKAHITPIPLFITLSFC
jgi:hypothetical protein